MRALEVLTSVLSKIVLILVPDAPQAEEVCFGEQEKNGVIRDGFWECIADSMPEESKIGEVFSDNWGYPIPTCKAMFTFSPAVSDEFTR